MSPTRPLSKQVTQDRIIDAAIHVFSESGYDGASLRTIARRADVNEVTLFRYFPRKLDLFVAAIQAAACEIKFPPELLLRMGRVERPGAILDSLFELLVDMAVRSPKTMRLVSLAALESQLSAGVLHASLRPAFDSLSAYLKACMEQKTIKPVDADTLAKTLILTVTTQLACAATMTHQDGESDKWRLPYMCRTVWLHGILLAN